MSEYVSNIKTSDGWKKIKDSEGRELISNNSQLIRSLQNTPLPAYSPDDFTRQDRVYIFLSKDVAGYKYGYIYYYDHSNDSWVQGWQYQTFELGTQGVNPCFISLPSEGFNVHDEVIDVKLTVFAFNQRWNVDYSTARASKGQVWYLWIDNEGNVSSTINIKTLDTSKLALIAYYSRYSVSPCSQCNVIIDDISFNSAPSPENNNAWISPLSEGMALNKTDDLYTYTCDCTVIAFNKRITVNSTYNIETDSIKYHHINKNGDSVYTDSITPPAGYALVSYFNKSSITSVSPVDIKNIYGEIVKSGTNIVAGRIKACDIQFWTGMTEWRNYINCETGIININKLRIQDTTDNTYLIENVQLSFNYNSSQHILVYDTNSHNVVELSNYYDFVPQKHIWIATFVPSYSTYYSNYPCIKFISATKAYYPLSDQVAIFGDSHVSGTENDCISRVLNLIFGIQCYNAGVGGSGWLNGWGGYDPKINTQTNKHSSGQFNFLKGVDVTYPKGTSYDHGTIIDKYLPQLIEKKIGQIYIHSGGNDIFSGIASLADWWDNLDVSDINSLLNNPLADRIVEYCLKLRAYNINTTIMYPIGRFYMNGDNYVNNNQYMDRQYKYIKLLDAITDKYSIDSIRTDRLFPPIAPYDKNITLTNLNDVTYRPISKDGIHPNLYGYAKIAASIANHYHNRNKINSLMPH